jgi:hypothetical protein
MMNNMKTSLVKPILGAALLIVGLTPWLLANQDGTTIAPYMRLPQSARASAMGDAFTAIADDAYATQYNPAGIAQISRRALALNHLSFIEETNSQFASFVLPVNRVKGSLGMSVNYFDLGEIERTDAGSATPVSGDNEIYAYNASLTWGQAIGDIFAIGATGKVISQDLAGTSDSFFAGDLGALLFLVPNRLALGASVLNMGPQVKIGTTDEDLPLTGRGGLAWHPIPEQWIISIEAEKPKDVDTIFHGGTEFIYAQRFVIRAGYKDNLEASGGLSAGAGFIWVPGESLGQNFFDKQSKINRDEAIQVRIDYGFVDYGDFDSTHRIGVHIIF